MYWTKIKIVAVVLLVLGLGGAVVTVVATLLVLPSVIGFADFVIAALIAAFPGMAWAYAAGKQQP